MSALILSVGCGLVTGPSLDKGNLLTVYMIEISDLISSEWGQAREPNPSRQKRIN
jgi:hypothetical protein